MPGRLHQPQQVLLLASDGHRRAPGLFTATGELQGHFLQKKKSYFEEIVLLEALGSFCNHLPCATELSQLCSRRWPQPGELLRACWVAAVAGKGREWAGELVQRPAARVSASSISFSTCWSSCDGLGKDSIPHCLVF